MPTRGDRSLATISVGLKHEEDTIVITTTQGNSIYHLGLPTLATCSDTAQRTVAVLFLFTLYIISVIYFFSSD